MNADETVLTGGNVNSTVVRVGNTVRRSTSASSFTVHQLLLHLESAGFSGSPRFLGVDEQDREILTFIEGETGIPQSIWQQDEPLIAAAKLLRAYHDATVDFVQPVDAIWSYCYPDSELHEVICHNDFAPYNFVYSSGIPCGIIDFDLAGPGPRLKDVAYAVYWMVPLSFNSHDQIQFTEGDIDNGSRRLMLFGEHYGIAVNQYLLDMVAEVLALMGDDVQMKQTLGHEAAERLKADGHLAHWQREAESFAQNRHRIEANIKEIRSQT